jgi:hypothetical protein
METEPQSDTRITDSEGGSTSELIPIDFDSLVGDHAPGNGPKDQTQQHLDLVDGDLQPIHYHQIDNSSDYG